MRVLFTALGGRPHLYPLTPLAWALLAAGHDVRFVSSPRQAADVVAIGLPVVAVGGSPQLTPAEREDLVAAVFGQEPWPSGYAADLSVLDEQQLELLRRLGRYLVAMSGAVLDEMIEFARRWQPALVVYEASTFAGAVAAAVLGVPGVAHHVGSDSYPRLELWVPNAEPLPEYAELFDRFGVPVSTVSGGAAALIEPTPPSMRVIEEPTLLAMRYIPFNGAGVVPAFLPAWLRDSAGRSRICLTWGYTGPSALGEGAAEAYRAVIDELSTVDASVLVLSTAEQLTPLGPLPERVTAASGVPLQFVVEHCDLLVHQGGDGTTLTGACYGVPQLAITRKPDAETPAVRLAATGAGIHLPHQRIRDDTKTVKSAASELLADSTYRAAARDLRAEIARQPPPAHIVPALEKLACP